MNGCFTYPRTFRSVFVCSTYENRASTKRIRPPTTRKIKSRERIITREAGTAWKQTTNDRHFTESHPFGPSPSSTISLGMGSGTPMLVSFTSPSMHRTKEKEEKNTRRRTVNTHQTHFPYLIPFDDVGFSQYFHGVDIPGHLFTHQEHLRKKLTTKTKHRSTHRH